MYNEKKNGQNSVATSANEIKNAVKSAIEDNIKDGYVGNAVFNDGNVSVFHNGNTYSFNLYRRNIMIMLVEYEHDINEVTDEFIDTISRDFYNKFNYYSQPNVDCRVKTNDVNLNGVYWTFNGYFKTYWFKTKKEAIDFRKGPFNHRKPKNCMDLYKVSYVNGEPNTILNGGV